MNNIFRIGYRFQNKYEIIEILSKKTGFGIIYKVKDHDGDPTRPFLVVKQLKKPTAFDLGFDDLSSQEQEEKLNQYWGEYLSRFEREAEALGKLGETYGQIPRIIEEFNEQNEYFYVQEFIEGYSLDQEVKAGEKIPEEKAVDLLIEILEILEYIQNYSEYKVIHRDIKPENIIRRTSDKKLVLIDFGLVKEVIIPGVKSASVVGGTRGYIAPEILRLEVSFASDIYSVGMIGVFAVTGKDPSDDCNAFLSKNWQKNATVSPEFATFLNKMVCDHDQRFQNASEALTELRQLRELRKSAKSTPVTPTRHQYPVRNLHLVRSRGIVIVAGAALLTLIGVIFIRKTNNLDLKKTYTQSEANTRFTIKYPEQWIAKATQPGEEEKVKISPENSSDKDNCSLEITVNIDDLGEVLSLDEYSNKVVKKIAQDPNNSHILNLSIEQPKLNNFEAYQITYSRQEDQCNLKILEQGTLFHKQAYYIIYKSPDKEYNQYWPVAKKMIDSFKIEQKLKL